MVTLYVSQADHIHSGILLWYEIGGLEVSKYSFTRHIQAARPCDHILRETHASQADHIQASPCKCRKLTQMHCFMVRGSGSHVYSFTSHIGKVLQVSPWKRRKLTQMNCFLVGGIWKSCIQLHKPHQATRSHVQV